MLRFWNVISMKYKRKICCIDIATKLNIIRAGVKSGNLKGLQKKPETVTCGKNHIIFIKTQFQRSLGKML